MKSLEHITHDILRQALHAKASDIHFHPRPTDVVLSMRINGKLHRIQTLLKTQATKIISHLKFKAGMDIGEYRRPQHGALQMRIDDTLFHLRLSTLPTPFFERLVIRLLPHEEIDLLQDLPLFIADTKRLERLLHYPQGLIVATGPTGSGKTTTMYALLKRYLTLSDRQVITVEDPVEKQTASFTQMSVNELAGLTYQHALKAALRHDPDALMVGEIRDPETAALAVRAALTGHLVFSTMHTSTARGALYRLREFGVLESDIQETLQAVISQRLIPLTCPWCEDECSLYCPNYERQGRKAIYDILDRSEVLKASQEMTHGSSQLRRGQLGKQIKKGIALGYLHERSYHEWEGD
ncbi:competence type IV pilus ATPase ComGA [Salsuginibacillus kocurii]|uniref:competence type IV pilus ATPase ComGA n=1 Tax=Salsuginibacillus kocurii TaxID=427078 RepID=UPI00036BE43C|nr:competence type IV pilus ATPase ComGA [Salsuginibacillus kocurii]